MQNSNFDVEILLSAPLTQEFIKAHSWCVLVLVQVNEDHLQYD